MDTSPPGCRSRREPPPAGDLGEATARFTASVLVPVPPLLLNTAMILPPVPPPRPRAAAGRSRAWPRRCPRRGELLGPARTHLSTVSALLSLQVARMAVAGSRRGSSRGLRCSSSGFTSTTSSAGGAAAPASARARSRRSRRHAAAGQALREVGEGDAGRSSLSTMTSSCLAPRASGLAVAASFRVPPAVARCRSARGPVRAGPASSTLPAASGSGRG